MIHDLCLYQQSCLFESIKVSIIESRLDTSYIKNYVAHNYKNNALFLTEISALFGSSNLFMLRESRN